MFIPKSRRNQIKWILITLYTVFAIVLVLALAIFKYKINEKHKIYRQLQHEIDRENKAIHMMNVEIFYLSSPKRIDRLYRAHSDLKPMQQKDITFMKKNSEHEVGATAK